MYICTICGCRDAGRGEISDSSQNPIPYAFKSHSSITIFTWCPFFLERGWPQADPIAMDLESSPWKTSLLVLGKVFWQQASLTSTWAPTWATGWAVNRTSPCKEILTSPLSGALTVPKSLNSREIAAYLPSRPWGATFISPERSIQHVSATAVQTRRNHQAWIQGTRGTATARMTYLRTAECPQGRVQRTPVAQQPSGKCQEPTGVEVQMGGLRSPYC